MNKLVLCLCVTLMGCASQRATLDPEHLVRFYDPRRGVDGEQAGVINWSARYIGLHDEVSDMRSCTERDIRVCFESSILTIALPESSTKRNWAANGVVFSKLPDSFRVDPSGRRFLLSSFVSEQVGAVVTSYHVGGELVGWKMFYVNPDETSGTDYYLKREYLFLFRN